jgi:hypothetical protein
VNLYPEAIPEGGKEPGALYRCPGTRLLVAAGSGPIRGEWQYNGIGYVVSGSELYEISASFVATLKGSGITGSGAVSMSDNGTQLFIAANPDGYIYNQSTDAFAEITDVDFPGANSVGYLNGYFVFTEPDSQRVWVTELLDAHSIDPSNFASAEAAPDGLVGLIIDHKEAWLMGTNSVEVWTPADGDFPLAPLSGGYIELGCASAAAVAKMDNSVFWLGLDDRGQGIVWRADGYTPIRVSTHALEYAISQYGSISDAIAYTYQQEGHSFYVLTFPSGNATWVYDAATKLWHQRAYLDVSTLSRHRSNCQMFLAGTTVVGDYANGNLYAMELDTFADNGNPQKWVRAWRALDTGQNDLLRTFQHELQIDCETGVGLDGDVQGSDPQAMLRWSDDGGHTWSNEHWRSMGAIGQYGRRVIYRRLGATEKLRDRVYELSGTDPVKVTLIGAQLRATKGWS